MKEETWEREIGKQRWFQMIDDRFDEGLTVDCIEYIRSLLHSQVEALKKKDKKRLRCDKVKLGYCDKGKCVVCGKGYPKFLSTLNK